MPYSLARDRYTWLVTEPTMATKTTKTLDNIIYHKKFAEAIDQQSVHVFKYDLEMVRMSADQVHALSNHYPVEFKLNVGRRIDTHAAHLRVESEVEQARLDAVADEMKRIELEK